MKFTFDMFDFDNDELVTQMDIQNIFHKDAISMVNLVMDLIQVFMIEKKVVTVPKSLSFDILIR